MAQESSDRDMSRSKYLLGFSLGLVKKAQNFYLNSTWSLRQFTIGELGPLGRGKTVNVRKRKKKTIRNRVYKRYGRKLKPSNASI